MKVRMIVVSFLLIVLMLTFASVASAQSRCSAVDVTPLSGKAGSTVYASGTTNADSTVDVTWDSLSNIIATINTDVSTGKFGANVTIPADATPGSHTLTLRLPSESDCQFTFTVEAAATPPAAEAPLAATPAATPAAKPATLPSTGFFLIVPAAGLVAAGMGGLMYRRRNR